MQNKTDFRAKAKIIRKELEFETISKKLCKKILQLEEFQKASNVLLFHPLKYEVNTLSLISEDKNFYLPRVNGNDLEICLYKNGDKLCTSCFNVLEPITKGVCGEILDIIILPALMADKHNYRLGYGKGFYDRFISKTNAITILPIPKELIVEKLPTEPHDKKVDIIITV